MRRLGLPAALMGAALCVLLHLIPQPFDASGKDAWEAPATTYSYGPEGTRALYVLLQQLDLQVQRLRRPDLGGLDPHAVLWVLTEAPFGRLERRALVAFVQAGGTLVAPPKSLGVVFTEAGLGDPIAREQPRTLQVQAGGNLALQLEHMPRALSGVRQAPAEVFASTPDGLPVVAAWTLGAGKLVSLGVAPMLHNAQLGRGDNGVFMARLALSLGTVHVFNEFKTGFGEGDIRSLLRRLPYRWGLAQAAAVALMALLALAWRRFPVQAQPPAQRRRSLDHVEAVGQLWERSQDAGLPLQALLTALDDRARARLGGAHPGIPFVEWLGRLQPERRSQAAACWAQAAQLLRAQRPQVDAARSVVAQLQAMEAAAVRG